LAKDLEDLVQAPSFLHQDTTGRIRAIRIHYRF